MNATVMYFATPEEAANAFYKALECCDLEAMMAVWGSGEDIVCVHPSGIRLIGQKAIHESWQTILGQREMQRMTVDISGLVTWSSAFIAVQSSLEIIYIGNDPAPHGPLLVTNVFMNGRAGWRLVSHHATEANESESHRIIKKHHSLH